MKRMLAMSLFALSLAVVVGCEAAPGLNKQFGYYIEYTPAPASAVVDATYDTLDQMGWMVMSSSESGQSTTIKARNTYNVRSTIVINPVPESSTKIAVNLSSDDAETLAREMLERIRQRASQLSSGSRM